MVKKVALLPVIAFILLQTYPLMATGPVRVRLDVNKTQESTVSQLLFGSFSEESWGDLTPGIYEQYIVNSSFENWYVKGEDDREKEPKTRLLWDTIPKKPGLAFPWEIHTRGGNSGYCLSEDCVNTSYSQKITVESGANASLIQRIALPDYRTDTYKVTFYAKSSGNVSMNVSIEEFSDDIGHDEGQPVAISPGRWKKYEVDIQADRSRRRWIYRYGIYNVCFNITGEGDILIDQVTLFPEDCIEGIYNPETMKNFKDNSIRMIRWPGGNFTSAYNWYNSIGPVEKRRSVPNYAWGGICDNLFGLHEFLRYCELTDMTPVIGVGFNQELIPPQEIADWVEYCNGGTDTKMGALRAQNGHPEPFNVKYWGIGNEVYGKYQQGHTDVKTYAENFIRIAKKMRRVDPDIVIIACGEGMQLSWHGGSDWNDELLRIAGKHIDMLDIHYYVYGPKKEQLGNISRDEYYRSFSSANHFMRDYLEKLRAILAKRKLEHIGVAMLEWGVMPSVTSPRIPGRKTFANLLCASALYNEMIRQNVQMGAYHNFSYYIQPVRAHCEPVSPRTIANRYYEKMSGGKVLVQDIGNMPTFDTPYDIRTIGNRKDVPCLDILSVKKEDNIYISVVSRETAETLSIDIRYSGTRVKRVSGETFTSTMPFEALDWKNANTYDYPRKENAGVTLNNDTDMTVTIPPLSLTFLEIELQL